MLQRLIDNRPDEPGSEVAVQLKVWCLVLLLMTIVDAMVFLPLPYLWLRVRATEPCSLTTRSHHLTLCGSFDEQLYILFVTLFSLLLVRCSVRS